MNTPLSLPSHPNGFSETHQVLNVSSELANINLYAEDQALRDAVARYGADWAEADLLKFGAQVGQQDYLLLGHQANAYPPELSTHDRFGRRIDEVTFHPAYHQLMSHAFKNGLHASPWTDPKQGAHVRRAALCLLQSQVEAGHGCPLTMTFAAVPTLRQQPDLAALWEPKITAWDYDPRNVPASQKTAITVGMGMTEKQGGSDVRANTTWASPVVTAGGGQPYQLTGHKWFLSAPMCDFFLVLAQTSAGLSCFLVPRHLPDGQKNGLHIIRLKDKMGNRSNASSEVEFRGAIGWLVGEEGRGVRTIIEMVGLTRFDCMMGSAALMRMGVAQAYHHCTQRKAFGQYLIDQPLMQNVLADLSIEYEASVAMTMRMAHALDQREHQEYEQHLFRLMSAVGKYWICKRAPQHTYEAMECIGGSGVMENCIMPRLYREAVINPIWEGSGNVQCLDVLRALQKTPAVIDVYFDQLSQAQGSNRYFDQHVQRLKQQFSTMSDFEFSARHVVDQMATAYQAMLLLTSAHNAVADAFCTSRLGQQGAHQYGSLPKGTNTAIVLARANPHAFASC